MNRKTFEVIAPFVVFLDRLSMIAKELKLNAVFSGDLYNETKNFNYITRPVIQHAEKEREFAIHEFIGLNEGFFFFYFPLFEFLVVFS